MSSDTVQVNLKGLFFALVFVIALIVFSVGWLTNDDPLWFLPIFNETPSQIAVYRDGCTINLRRGQPGFDEITQTINQALPQYEGYSSTFGVSPDSLQAYRKTERILEVFYAKPVTIHAPYRLGHPEMILIPLSGYFADARAVFGGQDGTYWSGALRLKTIEPLQHAVEQVRCTP